MFTPEVTYLHGHAVVPAKALEYKRDNNGKVIEKIPPKTHAFENSLREDLRKELADVKLFPTKQDIYLSIVHGLHSPLEYKNCDLDNRAKTIMDALQEVIYINDNQVKYLTCRKDLLKEKESSYYRIVIKIIDEKTEAKINKLLDDNKEII